jgi:hypothetical protein
MAKRDKTNITLGSGIPYIMEFSGTMPSHTDICKEENRLGYVKGGAELTYTEETYEEKDDLGYVSKIVTTSEEALLKLGLLTWNGESLAKLIDRSKTEEKSGYRVTKIGGAGNAKGKYYVVVFHQPDKVDGDLYVMIVGRNSAGASIAFAKDAGSKVEPEFRAIPHDKDGTLLRIYEKLPTTT